jgi:hypothetical protein
MTTTAANTVVPFRSTSPRPPSGESPLARLRALWEAHVDETRRARATTLFADIDMHTLRDIGAPDWIIAEAASRKRARDRVFRDLEWS